MKPLDLIYLILNILKKIYETKNKYFNAQTFIFKSESLENKLPNNKIIGKQMMKH